MQKFNTGTHNEHHLRIVKCWRDGDREHHRWSHEFQWCPPLVLLMRTHARTHALAHTSATFVHNISNTINTPGSEVYCLHCVRVHGRTKHIVWSDLMRFSLHSVVCTIVCVFVCISWIEIVRTLCTAYGDTKRRAQCWRA